MNNILHKAVTQWVKVVYKWKVMILDIESTAFSSSETCCFDYLFVVASGLPEILPPTDTQERNKQTVLL